MAINDFDPNRLLKVVVLKKGIKNIGSQDDLRVNEPITQVYSQLHNTNCGIRGFGFDSNTMLNV